MRDAYKSLVGKREEKRPIGRPRRRWEDYMNSDLKKIRWESMDWMHPAQDNDRWRALVNR
jgi:hypothetical protein